MKYWIVDSPKGEEIMLSTVAQVRRYLKNNPKVQSAWLHHWYHSDFVGCDEYTREELLTRGKGNPERGATAQWAQSRGKL